MRRSSDVAPVFVGVPRPESDDEAEEKGQDLPTLSGNDPQVADDAEGHRESDGVDRGEDEVGV